MKIKTKKNRVRSQTPNYQGVPPLTPKAKKIVFSKIKSVEDIQLDLPDLTEEAKTIELRKDYCYDCNTDELYWVMMAARCKKCDAVILGGDE